MAKVSIFLLGFMLLHCWVAMNEAKYVKYKDPKQPLNVRIKDLMDRMTLEEKIGQMTQIERKVASAEIMKKYYIGKVNFFFVLFLMKNKQKMVDGNIYAYFYNSFSVFLAFIS